ncbi:sensor domain-containing diguanylate cyclase [Thalassovita sp.]|uniref:sensor domain-containing diguanylate cyclase n=1 Tax=Thalassovita sp. TaxID=1979401 RepID=UPI002AB1CD23|nr:sensor domain-containing diguanylate cyclase [Thalassovita sp.]
MAKPLTYYMQQIRRAVLALGFVALITAVALLAVLKAPGPIVDRLIEDDIRAQSVLWQRQVILQLDDAEHSFETATVSEHDRHFLLLMVEASDVFRFHLFDKTGHVFWSTDTSKIGLDEERPYFREFVAQGQVYYVDEVQTGAEIQAAHAGHDAHDPNHAEPLIHPDAYEERHVAKISVPYLHNGQFDGAIEFYSDITELRSSFIARVRLMLAIIAAVVLSTMTIAGLALHRANRRNVAQLNLSNAKERDIVDKQLRLAREVQLLGELNEWLQSSHSLEEPFQMVARFMTHILPNAEGSVYVYSNSRDVLEGCGKWNGGEVKAQIHPEECWGLRRGRTYEFGASEVDFTCDHAEPHDGRPYYCFPILAHGETVGLMHLRAVAGKERAFRSNKKLAQMCAEQLSMAIANVRMRDQLQDQSVRDPLTGLFNRRHMTECLRKAINNSQNTGVPLSLIAVDVDHFKKFNDNHGHDAGDMILRAVGTALEKACDGDQVACRMGGEEFTLILPGVKNADVLRKAEHLRKAVEAISLRYGEKTLPTVTISLGVSHYPQHGTLPQELMRCADEALYAAKAKGRNQVRLANTVSPSPRDPSAQVAEEDATVAELNTTPSAQMPDPSNESLAETWDRDLAADRAATSEASSGEDATEPAPSDQEEGHKAGNVAAR